MKRKFFYDNNYKRKRRYAHESNYDTSGNKMGTVYNPDNEKQFYDYGGKPFNPDITDFTDDLDYTRFWNSPIIWNYPHGPVYERKRARYLQSIETRPLVSGDVVGKKVPIKIKPKDFPSFTPRAETLENMVNVKRKNGKIEFNDQKFEPAKKAKKNITDSKKNDPVKRQQFRDDMAFREVKQNFYDGYDLLYEPNISDQNRIRFQQRMNKSGLAKEVDYIVEHPDVILDKKVDRNLGIQMLPFLFEEKAMYNQFKSFVRDSQRGDNIYDMDSLNVFDRKINKIHDDVIRGKYSPSVGNVYMMHAMMGFYNDMIIKDKKLADEQFKKASSKEAMMQDMENYKIVFDNEFNKLSRNIKNKLDYSIRGLKNNNAVYNRQLRSKVNQIMNKIGVDMENMNNDNMEKLNNSIEQLVNNKFNDYNPNVTNIYQVVQQYNDNPIKERLNQLESNVDEKLSDLQQLEKMKEEIQSNKSVLDKRIDDVDQRLVNVTKIQNDTVKNVKDLTEIVNNDRKEMEDVKKFIKSMGSSGFWSMLKGDLGVETDEDLLHAIKMMDSEYYKGNDGKTYTHVYGIMKDLYKEGQKTIGADLAAILGDDGSGLVNKINNLSNDIQFLQKKQASLAEKMAAKIDADVYYAKEKMDKKKFSELNEKMNKNALVLANKGRKLDYISTQLEGLNQMINDVKGKLTNDETRNQVQQLQNQMNGLYNNTGIRLLNGDLETLTQFVNVINSNANFIGMLKNNVDAVLEIKDFNTMKENMGQIQKRLGDVEVKLNDDNILNKMTNLLENKWNITKKLEQTNARISGLVVGNGLFSPSNIKRTVADFLTSDPQGIAILNDMVHSSLLYGEDYWNDNQQAFKILDDFSKQQQIRRAGVLMETQGMNESDYGYDNFWKIVLRNYHPDENPIINTDDMIKRYQHFKPREKQFVDRAINLWHVLKDNYQNKLQALPLQLEENTYLRSPLMNYLQYIPVYVAKRNGITDPSLEEFKVWFARNYNDELDDNEDAIKDLIGGNSLVKAVDDVIVGGNDYQRLVSEINRDWDRIGGLRDYYIAKYGKKEMLTLPAQSEIDQVQNYARRVNEINPGWSYQDILNSVMKYGPIYILDPSKVTYKSYYALANKNVQSRDLVPLDNKSLVITGVNDISTIDDNEILNLMENRYTRTSSSDKRNAIRNSKPGTEGNPINVNDDPIVFVTNQAIDEIRVGTYNDGNRRMKAAKIKMAPGEFYKRDRHFGFDDWDIKEGDRVTFTPHAQKVKDVSSVYKLASRRQEDLEDKIDDLHITNETKAKLKSFRPSRYHSSKVTQHSEKYPFAFKD